MIKKYYYGLLQHKRVETDPKITVKLMRIGVTGSSGFLGSHLTDTLRQYTDAEVTVLRRNSLENFPDINSSKFINPKDYDN